MILDSPRPGGEKRLCTRRLSLFALLFTLILTLSADSYAQDQTRNEFWPEVDVFYRLDATYRLFFLVSPAISREDNYSEILTAAHVEMGAFPIFRSRWAQTYDVDRFRFLRLKAGIGYSSSLPSSDQSSQEWRGILEVTARYVLPLEILTALRLRTDLRWLDDGFSTRYRSRLTIERETVIGSDFVVAPYISVEPFYDTRYPAWARVQYQVGATFPVAREIAVEVYYGRQQNWRSQPERVNALGIVVLLYL